MSDPTFEDLSDASKSALSMLWNTPDEIPFPQAFRYLARRYGRDVMLELEGLLGGDRFASGSDNVIDISGEEDASEPPGFEQAIRDNCHWSLEDEEVRQIAETFYKSGMQFALEKIVGCVRVHKTKDRFPTRADADAGGDVLVPTVFGDRVIWQLRPWATFIDPAGYYESWISPRDLDRVAGIGEGDKP